MRKPLVSILIPSYNHEQFIDEAISSIARQTYSEWEVLICDDGSTDGSWNIIDKWRNSDRRIKAFKQNNRGVCATLNMLYRQARGEAIVTIGSDDALMPTRLERGVEDLSRFGEANVIFSGLSIIDEQGNDLADEVCPFVSHLDGKELISRLLLSNCVCAASAFIRRSALSDGELLARPIHTVQDYDLWLRLLRHGGLSFCKERLVRYRWHSGNLSKKNAWLSLFEQRRVIEEHAAAIINRHQLDLSVSLRLQSRLFTSSVLLGDSAKAARHLIKKTSLGSLDESELLWLLRFMAVNKMNQKARDLIDSFEASEQNLKPFLRDQINEIKMAFTQPHS